MSLVLVVGGAGVAVPAQLAGIGVAESAQSAYASTPTQNDKAAQAYAKQARKVEKMGRWLESSKLRDLTGDGIDEAIFTYKLYEGSGRGFLIYTYKSGKVKRLLKTSEYGMYKIVSYKKTKSFITYESGHGGETRTVYRLKSGKFRPVVLKARSLFPKRAWNYYRYTSGTKTSATRKATYTKLVKKLRKGAKQTIRIM